MVVLFTIVGLILLISGGIGLVITNVNLPVGTFDWIDGNLTYGVFVVIGIATIALIAMTPRES